MTGGTVVVASPGGHVDEAYEIVDRFAARADRSWITARTAQTEALLAGERVDWAPEVRSRQAVRAAGTLGLALRLLRARRPARLLSTGAALAVPYLLAARALRIPVTYVESATRVDGPSLTGRICERIPGIELFHQGLWERRRWSRFGSVFDGFEARETAGRPVSNLLVTLGTERFPFPRAIAAAREALPPGCEIAWQTGNTPIPEGGLPGEVRAWWPGDELAARASNADAVITHAGVGSVLMVLRSGVCPIVMPRTARLGEHVDDHQAELARMLEGRGLAVVLPPDGEAASCIEAASGRRIVRRPPGVGEPERPTAPDPGPGG